MKSPFRIALCILLVGAAASLPGCKNPKYVAYPSEFEDAVAQVPYGWDVYLDQQDSDFYNYLFVGPFDPDFYRGVPTLSVRWHAFDKYHRLRGGEEEIFFSVRHYIRSTLKDVYGPEYYLKQPVQKVAVGAVGREGQHFVVVSPAAVPEDTQFGASQEQGGGPETAVIRQHAYVVVAVEGGIYVLVYPATQMGYDKYIDRFNPLINTFVIKKSGPDGPAF